MTILLIFLTMQISTVDGFHQDYVQEFFSEHYFEQTYFVDAGIHAEMFKNMVFINMNGRVPMYLNKKAIDFKPLSLSSYVEVGINFNFITIGYKHICIHPVAPYVDTDIDIDFHDSWYDEYYIKIKTDDISVGW